MFDPYVLDLYQSLLYDTEDKPNSSPEKGIADLGVIEIPRVQSCNVTAHDWDETGGSIGNNVEIS